MNYTFTQGLHIPLLHHTAATAATFGDHAEPIDDAAIAARVASGDYFMELASRIDELALRASGDATLSASLDAITAELLRLQARYRIVTKESTE